MKLSTENNDIWVTSDPHYGHTNIAGPEVSAWKKGYRDFKSTHHMNQCIVGTFNKYIKEYDTLICMGDWSFGGKDNIAKFREQIVCKNILLTYGNHDHHIKKYPELRSLFTYCNDILSLSIDDHNFFMSHYSHQVWINQAKGTIHLFGHSHANLEGLGKSMDVGIDVAYKMYGEYRPFHISEIIKLMEKREIHTIDHHTNDR